MMFDLIPVILACAPGVHPATMLPLIQAESRQNQFAIGVQKGRLARQPVSLAEASATAAMLVRQGVNFDAGYAQINSANFARTGLTAVTAFDPCSNLAAASLILRDCYGRAQGLAKGNEQYQLRLALSCYNTGGFSKGLANGYVRSVELAAQRVRNYCQRYPQMAFCQGEVRLAARRSDQVSRSVSEQISDGG